MITSQGILRYSKPPRLVVALNHDFGLYYRSLVPNYLPIQGTRFPAHITVLREGREVPKNTKAWGKYEGERVKFKYDPYIHVGWVYYWLEVWCKRLEGIRTELGLAPVSEWTKPPNTRKSCYHITIGNRKHIGPHPRPLYRCCGVKH